MQTVHNILTLSVAASGTFDAFDLIGFDGAKIAANDGVVLGVALSPSTVSGDMTPVLVTGVARLKASGAITAGSKVVSNASGGVRTVGAGTNPCGVALATVADGEFVDILLSR